jgi:hypothetical protein
MAIPDDPGIKLDAGNEALAVATRDMQKLPVCDVADIGHYGFRQEIYEEARQQLASRTATGRRDSTRRAGSQSSSRAAGAGRLLSKRVAKPPVSVMFETISNSCSRTPTRRGPWWPEPHRRAEYDCSGGTIS